MINAFELEKGKLFVSGLHWQALSGGPSEVKAEVEKLAALEGFDLAVWRVSSVQQVGFADTKKGFKAGMMSAAAVVSKTIDEEEDVRDFLCGIPLPDGRYLYVAQSEGVILPDGDSIGTAEEVRGRMLADMSVGKDWAKIYAPLAWGMQGAAERSFEDFLPQKNGKIDYRHKWWVLKPIKTSIRSVAKIVLPIAALSILMGAGMVSYKRWQIAKANAEAAAAAAAMATENAPKPVVHPWKDKAKAMPFAGNCVRALRAFPHVFPGNWVAKSFTCSADSGISTMAWHKGDGAWIDHLREVVPAVRFAQDGMTASVTTPLMVGGGDDEALIDEGGRSEQLMGISQRLGLTLSISPVQAQQPPSLPGAAPEQQPVLPTWKELKWSIQKSSVAADEVLPLLDGAGFRVDQIVANYKEGVFTWDMEGIQYVQP